MATILSGREPAQQIKDHVKATIQQEGLKPGLGIIVTGNGDANSPSARYVRNKIKDCGEVGITLKVYSILQECATDEAYIDYIEKFNNDPEIHGIIVQLPLPEEVDTRRVLNTILPEKDVDGLTQTNIGRLWEGRPLFKPCTPAGVMHLLEYHEIDVWGKHVVIMGRSDVVGKPLAALMMKGNATVSICHSRTYWEDKAALVKNADIIVSAVGPNEDNQYIISDLDVTEATHPLVLVDVGLTVGQNGTVYGDIDPDCHDNPNCVAYTPVPGGVGPMTRAMLLKNVLKAVQLQK